MAWYIFALSRLLTSRARSCAHMPISNSSTAALMGVWRAATASRTSRGRRVRGWSAQWHQRRTGQAGGGLHALRHSFASWCINPVGAGGIGLTLKEVQERMGHAGIEMTADRYGHLFPKGDATSEVDASERAARIKREQSSPSMSDFMSHGRLGSGEKSWILLGQRKRGPTLFRGPALG